MMKNKISTSVTTNVSSSFLAFHLLLKQIGTHQKIY